VSTVSYTVRDSTTMLRRSLRHIVRYPSMTVILIGMPIILLLLFVFVFGQTLGAGLGSGAAGRATYANYVTPGILLITIASAAQGTAISVAMDMSAGLIARFRTMPIARSSVLTGHAVASFLQTMLSVLVVVVAATAVGFRPTAGPIGWVGALGLLALFTLTLTWLSVALGLAAKSPESASNLPMFLVLLPFLGSGFVPADSMPAALRWFAAYQPFTPVTESVRGLLLGGPVAAHAITAVAWSVVITVGAYVWSQRLFDRRPGLAST
jgi:ABC-2 type transport system permease protein